MPMAADKQQKTINH